MTIPDIFFDAHGRLRSGWRFIVFVLSFLSALLLMRVLFALVVEGILRVPPATINAFFARRAGLFATSALTLAAACVCGWLCGRWLENLPWRALGWGAYRGWWRDFLYGSLCGALALCVAVAVGAACGAYSVQIMSPSVTAAAGTELAVAFFFFIVAAAFEEALFRGYPLQTLLRSLPVWVALIPSFVFFGAVHLGNPHAVPGYTFINTMLAGLWLSLGYLRTRSLWFPLGLHWSWNWTMGALFGLPVSGINEFSNSPLLRLISAGPDWLTGGVYGPEGGLIATIALLISCAFIWRTRTLTAADDMRRLSERRLS